MKKLVSAMLVLVMLLSFTACNKSTSTPSDAPSEPSPQSLQPAASETPSKEPSKAPDYFAVDAFVNAFNADSEIKISDIEEININDKEGGHYRTEFRLLAFKDAPAKYGRIGESTIEIINYGSMRRDAFRIYVLANSVDSLQDIAKTAIKIYDPAVTDDQIEEAIGDLASGISFYLEPNITGTCSNSELMIDCSNVDFAG